MGKARLLGALPALLLAGALQGGLVFAALPLILLDAVPVLAASALSAWRISREGVLELRTSPDITLQAFYEAGRAGLGPRVWIDLPGAPLRTRSLPGGGALREVRVGKPTPDSTRLVIEFAPGTEIDPKDLRLEGTARDRWRLEFKGLAATGIPPMGEGELEAPAVTWQPPVPRWSSGATPGATSMPEVPRGRFRVVIDPGHGGPDPGAVGINGLRETDVVLDVSLQVAQLLQQRGVQVLLTRTTEVDVDLPPRVALANSSGADLFLSIHANALSMARPDVNGIETFFFESASSRSLAAAVQQEVLAVSPGSPDRGVRQGRFFVIRRTVMPAALVEMGFVTGQLDSPRLADPDHRRRLARAIAAGLLNYLRGGRR